MRTTTISLMLALGVPSALGAQIPSHLQPGTRVRITYDCDRVDAARACRELDGLVEARSADSLTVLRHGELTPVPMRDVTRLRMATGRRVTAGRALGYPVVGLFLGGLVGVVAGYASCSPCDNELEGLVPVAGAAFVGGLGLVTGLVVGLIPRETWEDVPLERYRVDLAPRAGGGVSFGVTVAF